VTQSALEAPYRLKRVREMLGLSRTVVTGLIRAGFVSPQRGSRNEYQSSFQDLMLLRTAQALQKGGVPPRKILRSLAKLHAESGQLLMDFEVAESAGTVAFIQPEPAVEPPNEQWFARAGSLEATDPGAAEAAYRRRLQRNQGA
jgi:hypothetical protein